MFGDDENFEETLRSVARELARSVERAMDKVDADDVAEVIGVDPLAAREWVDSASSWLRANLENLGAEAARQVARPRHTAAREDPLPSAAPHPLDVPSEEQGLALAALDSGRWTVEPGTHALAGVGEGPGPSDALGIVRELRVRDWIAADGEITLVGSHALSRWLDFSTPR
ncbi:MAG TPA: hypothetical protein VIX82_09765 [Solirubrobacteraceae bacterium]